MVTHPSTNQARHRVTSIIEANVLPLSQAATKHAFFHQFIEKIKGVSQQIKCITIMLPACYMVIWQ